ncbi:MAG: hypothetical protein D6680_22220 [Cyanobacteria bacterium J007]|nr:MAG: hypothetical protein D6680_22220 [Cyanobacteria bacterium J007]
MKLQGYYHKSLLLFIALTVAIGIFFRFYNLDKKVYWIDEIHTSVRVVGYQKTEFVDRAPTNQIITRDTLHQFQTLSPERGWGDTVEALAGNAEHTPIYYLLCRLWMEIFGSSPTVTRSLAALISLFAFPAIYWLCWELFRSPPVGAIAIALLAVSPLQVLYAQEARQYSLFVVTTLISSAALLRSLRQPHWKNWALYTLTVIVALYSHLISILVIFAHGIYVLFFSKFFSKQWLTTHLKPYLIAAIAGGIPLIPWGIIYFLNSSRVGSWLGRNIPTLALVRRWFINLSSLILDVQIGTQQRLFDVELGRDAALNFANPAIYAIPAVTMLVIYALYRVVRETPQQTWGFIAIAIAVPGLTLMLPDLFSGGQRSGVARYLFPSYVSIQIALAYLFARRLQGSPPPWRYFWRGLLALVLTAGVLSCAVSSQAQTWWNKYSCYYNAEVAAIVNRSPNPLVVSSQARVSRLVSLSYLLGPHTRYMLAAEGEIPKAIDREGEIFLFRPSQALFDRLQAEPRYELKPVHRFGHIWRVDLTKGAGIPRFYRR